jgi:hypothetical protein
MDERNARQSRRGKAAAFSPQAPEHAPGRRSYADAGRATRTLEVGKRTLVDPWVGDAAPTRTDVAAAVARGYRHLEQLHAANTATDHAASCEASFQLGLALEAARADPAEAPCAELIELEAAAAPALAVAFTPSRAAVDEAGPSGAGGREHWERDVNTWRAEAVQRRAAGAGDAVGDPVAVAQRGVASASSTLPYLERIQQSFGRHDVSHVRVATGGEAAVASAALGASAYAVGDRVAFASTPDLHTAAHEAAHVVQQRGGVQLRDGIDGGAGDAHEWHADAVADKVVRGESAEALLDDYANGGGGSRVAVQRDRSNAPVVPTADEPTTVSAPGAKWPVFARSGKPYDIISAKDPVRFWSATAWIRAGEGFQVSGAHGVSPACAAEIITALGWVAPDRVAAASKHLVFDLHRDVTANEVSASAFYYLGLPTAQAVVSRASRKVVQVATPLAWQDITPGSRISPDDALRLQVIRALGAFTGLAPITGAIDTLRIDPRFAEAVVENGVVLWNIDVETGNQIFGFDEASDSEGPYTRWLRGKPDQATTKPDDRQKLKLDNYYGKPVPAHFVGEPLIAEAGHPKWIGLEVAWPANLPDAQHEHVPTSTTGHRNQPVALAECDWTIVRDDMVAVGAKTDVAELEHVFPLPFGRQQATFEVAVTVSIPEYFTPATYVTTVEAKSTDALMGELRTAAFADLETRDETQTPETFDASGSGEDDHGLRTSGTLPSAFPATHKSALDPHALEVAAKREQLEATKVYLEAHGTSKGALAAVDHELATLDDRDAAFQSDQQAGSRPFQIRGTYLSREEGVESGTLLLYGSAHVKGSGLGAKVVVQIRDLSRRFSNEDMTFTGSGLAFEEALKAAFTDEAKAYPLGVLAIEAEEISSIERPMLAPILGDATGKTIGFQLGTDSRWKRVKSKVWDPTVSFVVNTAGMIAMGIFPPSAVVVAPLLAAYNSVGVIDRMKTQEAQGTLTLGTAATSVGEIALNLLPFAGEAKAFTSGWYLLEAANWGGQAILLTASALQSAQHLQANDVAQLASLYEQLEALESSGADASQIAVARNTLMDRARVASDRIDATFAEQIEQNGLMAISGSVVHRALTMPASERAVLMEHATSTTFDAQPHMGPATFDGGEIAARVPGASYDHGVFRISSTGHPDLAVSVRRIDGPLQVLRAGDRAVIDIPLELDGPGTAKAVADELQTLRAGHADEVVQESERTRANASAELEGGPVIRNVLVDHPDLVQDGRFPPEMMLGSLQRERAAKALTEMSSGDYATFQALAKSVTDPVAEGFLYKAVAAGNSLGDIGWLAGEMVGHDRGWLIDNLTLSDPRGVGNGLKQQWSTSCNAATTVAFRGNSDPVFSLRTRTRNMNVSEVDISDPAALNMHQADVEKQYLESHYVGTNQLSPRFHQGIAMPRNSEGVGRFADDLLNLQTAATGQSFSPLVSPTGKQAVDILNRALTDSLQVPLVIGDLKSPYAHYVLVQGRRGAGTNIEFQIFDPWAGEPTWVSAHDIENDSIPGDFNKVNTVEVPTSTATRNRPHP